MKNTYYELSALTNYLKKVREKDRILLTSEEEKEYIKKIKQGDLEAREEFITYNLRLVIKYALKNKRKGIPVSDLIQYGNMGLMHAIDKYDEKKDNKFSTYAVYWIVAYINRGINTDAKMIRFPIHYYDNKPKFEETYNYLKEKLDREPTIEELAKALHVLPKSIEIFFEMNTKMVSLEETGVKEELEEIYTFDDHTKEFYQTEFYNDIKEIIEVMPISEKSKNLFWDLSGLKGEALPVPEVAKKYGVSSNYVRQERDSIFEYLSRNKRIIAYYDKAYDKVYSKKR